MADEKTLSPEKITAAIFWLLMIVPAAGGWWLWKNDATVLMNVSTGSELVSGAVTFDGVPVCNGVVHVAVFNALIRTDCLQVSPRRNSCLS